MRDGSTRWIFAGLLALAVSGESLEAQGRDRGIVEIGDVRNSDVRGGFYGSVGFGGGREKYKFSDESSYSTDLTKPTVTLRFGGTPSTRTRVGGEIFAWGNEANDGFQSFSTFLLTVQHHFADKDGLYLRGGLGFASSGTEFHDGGSAYESGFATSFGAGWDIALSRKIAIGPTLDFYQGTFTRRGEATLKERVVNIGVQVTYQSGRR